jgi:hypothetical protein
LTGVLDDKKARALLARLQAVMGLQNQDRPWKFGDKLMYGTDWHMIINEPRYEEYLARWDHLIKQVDGGKWRQPFFAGNAKKFLQLDALAADLRFPAAVQQGLQGLSDAVP